MKVARGGVIECQRRDVSTRGGINNTALDHAHFTHYDSARATLGIANITIDILSDAVCITQYPSKTDDYRTIIRPHSILLADRARWS
uniref:Amb_all domain-containing protein n=1 Tax=Heterorhabditis bacteriophora TaxID=37862 RepID=A0A1I7WPM9_HETBA